MCTHPPLVFTFPPRPAGYDTLRSKRQSRSLDLRTTLHSDLNLLPMSLEEVSRGMSPYLCFDYTRMGSTPRPRRPSHVNGGRSSGRNSRNHSADGPRTATADFLGVEELPSHDLVALADMHFDPRSLNMHLALRVQEVLACAEEMWRFVVGYQEKYLSAYDELGEGTWRGLTRARQAFHEDLIGLHRKDFDDMLTRFRLYVRLFLPIVNFSLVCITGIWKTTCYSPWQYATVSGGLPCVRPSPQSVLSSRSSAKSGSGTSSTAKPPSQRRCAPPGRARAPRMGSRTAPNYLGGSVRSRVSLFQSMAPRSRCMPRRSGAVGRCGASWRGRQAPRAVFCKSD